ncbi:MAG: amidohydrolase/deacetylase family metallohydrolase [Acidobacteria bacterium]|nr:amidohydrolase/deacetylase family metallohydrolase [Acidobacteriota bacterium]
MQMMRWMVLLLVCLGSASAQKPYELLLKGGHLIDPKNGVNAPRDVAISEGKIVAVGESLDPEQADKVVDVSGLYVMPGLVDIHAHVFTGSGRKGVLTGDTSVYPDGFSFRAGVTTLVDVGSSGRRNFEEFKKLIIDRAGTRVLSMLNIVGGGMGGGEIEQNVDDMEPGLTAQMAKKYPEIIVGIKTAHFQGPEWVAVDRAVEAGKLAKIPVMVDFGDFRPERPFEELVLKHLRPGDMYTHFFIGRVPMLDAEGKVRPYLFEARKRGVKFDVGHGQGSFWWSQAVPAVRQGFLPDSISTDLHTGSMNSGMKTMANLMSKFLSLDVPLEEVVKMSTWNPSQQIQRPDLGHLTVGAEADIAVMRVDTGKFGFLDVRNARFEGTKLLVPELTIRRGRVMWDLNGRAGAPWTD